MHPITFCTTTDSNRDDMFAFVCFIFLRCQRLHIYCWRNNNLAVSVGVGQTHHGAQYFLLLMLITRNELHQTHTTHLVGRMHWRMLNVKPALAYVGWHTISRRSGKSMRLCLVTGKIKRRSDVARILFLYN